jgi:hypothetical protein
MSGSNHMHEAAASYVPSSLVPTSHLLEASQEHRALLSDLQLGLSKIMAEILEEMTEPSAALPYIYESLCYNDPERHPIRLMSINQGEPGSPISCTLFPTYLVRGGNTRQWNFERSFQSPVDALDLDLELE